MLKEIVSDLRLKLLALKATRTINYLNAMIDWLVGWLTD